MGKSLRGQDVQQVFQPALATVHRTCAGRCICVGYTFVLTVRADLAASLAVYIGALAFPPAFVTGDLAGDMALLAAARRAAASAS